ncbi:Protein of unknown function [Lactobacillus acidophilus DSM 9126]|nr:Protein of unknown function [Lactobacillus acidophilus DSM 20079 = JCM 1132 = NBRC 13951 = CIP 76.13]CDF70161.1 Protein of unknown function [Lactobacillus acidophilus CIRM-BIA 442]CDF71955.1 Protein of unknown function [Lactobacillus acidophilus CIRM-BIA 445]CDF73776.1 Protein of unknown function [Lactobacillus acidophilus DSM 9126]CDF75780.1 Protein of unknown function [Lactobacillus acidophilus DSM 20242]
MLDYQTPIARIDSFNVDFDDKLL